MSEQLKNQKIRLGDLLVQQGAISEEQLHSALAEQKNSGQRLGRVLTDLGYLSEHDLLGFLSRQLAIPFVDLTQFQFNPDLCRLLPETMARRFRAIVLEEKENHLLIGMVDPMDIFALDELSRILKQSVRQAVVRESELLNALDIVYRRTEEITHFAEELEESLNLDAETFELDQLSRSDGDTPVAKLLASIFEDAVQVRASDIHIEPDEHELRIRQRVDGVLQEHVMKETRVAAALVLRLKLLSGLNISEKRLPQDGRFNIDVKNKTIDVRLSTLPLQHGEAVVMRLLDHSNQLTDLTRIGMPDSVRLRFEKLIHKPHGLILVTGPTGSGKTTTLYGALSKLNTPQRKIITAEDPVEYRLPRINQVHVRHNIGLDFASILRVALRQDPDVMLIGEIRDVETAEIAMRASMTGHMVLSTLHTGDAISTAARLLDMGVESYLLAACLKGIVAQRLIRKNCEYCTEPYQPEDAELNLVLTEAQESPLSATTYKHGKGCPRCNHTGYRGRIGLFELLEITPKLAADLRKEDIEALNLHAGEDPEYEPLFHSALRLARAGVTTIEEVLRVAEVDDNPTRQLAATEPELPQTSVSSS
ncbi:MAG: Flp pilus assembly complex ATPase component TadA [Pseudomonadales bacterium]|nr:Flp pilus assembly complex ATPase component TadA [Pseudomonadales bacterium]